MSAAESTVLELVGLIYDAAGEPARWLAFLERLGQALGAAQGTVYMEDLLNRQGNAVAVVGYNPAFARSYDQYYAARNVYLIRGKRLLWPGNVCTSQMLCSDAEAHRSEFYNDWITPQGVSHALMAALLKEGSLTGTLGLVRKRGAPQFSKEDLSLLKTLMPHLQRALQLHGRITRLQTEHSTVTDALNRWHLGVILLDIQRRVVLMNRSAEELVNRNDGLVVRNGQLRAARSTDTMALQRLIFGSLGARNGNGIRSPGGAIALPRPSGKRPLSVLVTPACASPALFPVNGAAAAIFVSDPESTTEPDTDCLARLYDLTPAESRLALLLMQGKSTEEAAAELSITKNAVHFHLKHVFSKTGTRRQAELVRLLLTGPAQLRVL